MSDRSDDAKLSRRVLIKGAGLAGFRSLAAASRGRVGAAGRTTVSLWGNHPEWQAPMRALLDAFEAANPDIRIDLTEVVDYSVKLDTAVAGGAPPDILGLGEGTLPRWLAAGSPPLLDLTGKIDLSGLTMSARSQVTINGRDYACPLASYTVGLAIQRPLFAKHGLTPPKTWGELVTVAKALRDAGETAMVVGGKAWIHTFFMYIGLASSVLGLDGLNAVRAGTRKLTDPDLVAAAQLLLDLKPCCNVGFEATDYETAKAIFAEGRGAMTAAGTADFTGFRQINPTADLGFVAWPGPSAGRSATTTGFELLYGVSSFASGDSQTSARLVACSARGLRLDPAVTDPIAYLVTELGVVGRFTAEFDLIHNHFDYLAFPSARLFPVPTITTCHGRLDLPEVQRVYRDFAEQALVAISADQRAYLPEARWVATVFNAVDVARFHFQPEPGDYLVFLGRISPEKRPDRAIEIARDVGMRLVMAAKIDPADQAYWEHAIAPLVAANPALIEYVGEVDEDGKDELLGGAWAYLFPIDWPEPFGLTMAEAMATGTPVIAYRAGSAPEVVADGETGFVCDTLSEMVAAVGKVGQLDRAACRRRAERLFSPAAMADGYERAYAAVLADESGRTSPRRPTA